MQDTTYSNDVDMTDAPPASTTEHHDSMSDAARVTANYKGSLSSESGVVPSIEITDSTGAALPFRMGWLNTRSTPRSDPRTPTFSPITPPLHLLPTSTPHAPSFLPMVPPPQPQSTSTSAQANTPFNFEQVQDRNKEEVKDRIFSEVLVHSYPVELHRKRFFRLTTEQGKPSVLTVGMGKSKRTPENRHIVPRGLNTNSPTNLFLVSVAFCARGLRTYYGNNNFVFGSFKELDEWLQNIQDRRMFVRNLTLRSTWEVGFTKSEVRPEMLRMDHLGGIVTTPTMHAFQFLTSITLDIHCIQQLERWDLKTRSDTLAKEPKAAEMSQEFARWSAERVLEAYRKRQLHGRNIETSVKVTFICPPVTDFGKSFTKGPNKTLIVKEMEKPVFKHQFPPLTMDDL